MVVINKPSWILIAICKHYILIQGLNVHQTGLDKSPIAATNIELPKFVKSVW